ncbi:MAG TPA: ABC transporter substrate-binding protein [Acetobacteraceae bacterium]|nr:ABC transporter substrate-binding protein [Acetobacteraceae bacterium]
MRRLLLAAAAAVSFTAPAFAQDAPTQTLRIALRQDPDLLDPTLARTYVGRIVFMGLCDKLFDINEKLEILPQLAAGYEWTDSKTLVLKLRPNVQFQDGAPMDAAAVKYSLERHLTMQGSSRRGEISAIEHVDVVDPTTVRVALKTPYSPLLAALTDRAGMIVSPKAAEAAGKDFALHPVCAGPFKFTERVAQDRIVLDRFPGYWNAGAIHFARVIYQPIVDSSVRLANLEAGSVDMVEYILPTDANAVKSNPKLRLVLSNNLGYDSININVGHGARATMPFGRDARVRKAFELSIDRTALIQVLYNGLYEPTAQAVSQDSPFYAENVQPPARDVAKAKALLAEAGVKTPLAVTLIVENSPIAKQLGEVLQSMSAEAGFDTKIQQMEFASSLDVAERGDFEAYNVGWSGRPDPDGNLWNFLHTGAPLNYPGYSNPDVDKWLDEARQVTDIGQRRDLYAKVAAQTETDLPIMYLDVPKNIVGMSAKVSGFVPVPDGMIRLTGLTMAP